jgi:hypothetical protein
MRRRRTTVFLSLAVLMTAFAAACSSPPEEPILQQFFRASRLNDSTSLASFSVAKFSPQTDGTIASFNIVNVSPEQRTPLRLPALAKEHEAVRDEEMQFTKRKDTFYLDNIEAISRVLKAESSGAKVTGKDAEVQATWSKLRQESAQSSKKLAEAQRKLKTESAIVQLSLDDPNNPVDATKHDGDMVSKDVTISAPVRLPNGTSADRTYIMTMQRAVLKANPEIAGKWIITSIKDTTASPAAKTS